MLLAGVTGGGVKDSSAGLMEISPSASLKEIQGAIKKQTKKEDIAMWVERLEAVDRIILTLQQYDFVSGLDEVDFLLFMMRKWKAECEGNLGMQKSPTGGKSISSGDVRDSTQSPPKKKKKDAAVVGSMNPYEAQFLLYLPPLGVKKKKKKVVVQEEKSSNVIADVVMKAVATAALNAKSMRNLCMIDSILCLHYISLLYCIYYPLTHTVLYILPSDSYCTVYITL